MAVDLREKVGDYTISIGLDRRKSYSGKYRLALRFTQKRKVYYHHLGGLYSVQEFTEIENAEYIKGHRGKQGKNAEKHKSWAELLSNYVERIRNLNPTDNIKAVLTGNGGKSNFIEVWDEVIRSKKAGTAASYQIAETNFLKSFGLVDEIGRRKEDAISGLGFKIDTYKIHEWVQLLTDRGLSKATIGIYLRTLKVVVKECIKCGFMESADYPFSEKCTDKVSIPRGASRRHEMLNVGKMTILYKVFSTKDYPGDWGKSYAKEVHESLGYFLAMYLGNGMNLADLARLRYDYYFEQNEGKAIRFYRTKTKDRTDNNSEVIVPVIPELRRIMDGIAAPYEKGALIFPKLLNGAKTDREIMRRVQQENQNIRKRVRKLTEHLGWAEPLSPTWCRHSFATNLIHAGVPLNYVSDAMGHSIGKKDVTMGYVNNYPLEKQIEYNSKLLNTKTEAEKAKDILNSLSDEEKEVLLKLLEKQND